MKESSKESDQIKTSRNSTPRRVTHRQTQIVRGLATRTRSQSQTHMISLGYLNDISQSFTQFTGPTQCWLSGIIKQNDPKANCPKIIKSRYAEIRDLVSKDILRAILRAKLPDGANMITVRFVLAKKSGEDKEERYKARYFADGHLDIIKDYLVHGAKTIMYVSVRMILVVVKIKGFRM